MKLTHSSYIHFSILLSLFFLISSCTSNSKTTTNQKNATNLYNKIITQINEGNVRQAENVDALLKLVKNESPAYQSLGAIGEAMIFNTKSSLDLAHKKYLEGKQLLKKEPVDTLLGICNKGIAIYHKNKNNLPKALKYFQKALSNFKKAANLTLEAETYASMSQMYFDKENLAEAKKYIEKAMFLLKNNKENEGYLRAAHTLANISGISGNFQKALKIDDECLLICAKINSKRSAATFLDNKANCFLYSNQLDSAETYFQKCLVIDLQIGQNKQIADSYMNLGNLFLFRNEFEKSESFIQKSILLADKENQLPIKLKALTLLKNVYLAKGNSDEVIKIQEQYQKTYKQLISEKNESSLAEYEVVYETQNKEKLLAEEVANSRKKNSLLILATFLVIIAFLLFRHQRSKGKQEAIKARINQELQEEKSMAKLQEQRLDISRELHDSVGSKLTFISSVADNLKNNATISSELREKKLESLANFAESSITELRDTIWVLNTKNLTINELINRVAELVREAKDSTEKVAFSFTTSNENNVQLSSKEGMNLFRVVQEMVNNALKYAEATDINIEIEEKNNCIEVFVSDNGKGFLIDEKKNVSFGMENMRIRLEEINAKYSLTSQLGKGTQMKISLKTTINA